ncbi:MULTISPECIES: hypothetical protein [Rhizobium]|jgi:DNA helicase-2/ATP-dependent DNA helicase PcrA|uniref:hypothetical protein n=1 Tax=Rhizobium TaxID=379 RepID=UPI000364B0A0|nr:MULTISPECIES: hypothetical protein [Rhizobium]MCB2401164.1 hypothetical protein [Rhizobium ruizarguesonis]
MTGADKAELNKVIAAHQQGRRRGQTKFGFLFPTIDDVVATDGERAMLVFLQGMRDRPDAHLYRREMFYAMRSALQNNAARQLATFSDSVWEVQNRVRHTGDKYPRLFKGQEQSRFRLV